MANAFKYSGVCTLLALVSLNSFADDHWNEREAHMQCGPAMISITAECKTDPEDKNSNICKDVKMKASQGDNVFSAKLPYMPIEQKKKLESQKFTFLDEIDITDWAPQEMFCIDDKYVLIGYWDGMNDAETIDGSLTSNISAPIFDLNGNFISEEKSKQLRKKTVTTPEKSIDINFVYGTDE